MPNPLWYISKPLRSLPQRRWAIGCLTVGLVVLSPWQTGCGTDEKTGSDMAPAFLTPVAAAEEAGLTVYWLGASFEVGDVLFSTREAKFPEGIAGVPLQGLEVVYSSQPEPAGSLDLQLLSRSDWDQVKEKVMNPPLLGVTRRTVSVGGREGELLFLPLGTRPLNILRLVLDLGDVVVVAQTHAGGPVYPDGPDYTPFINNPDLLIQVMEDLRPYPE
jgi:hypothetical protein